MTGVSVFNQDTRDFEFRPGGVFANIVVGDEINRASPKTQSALLECMEERQVTVDTHDVPARRPVHGDRHPEPDRDGGHLPAARGPARPVHGPAVDRLPGARGRAADAGRAHRRQPAGRRGAGHHRRRRREADRGGPRGVRLARRAALRHRPGHGHPPLPRPAARRLAAGHAAPGPRRQGVGGARAARLRRARRRAAAGPPGAVAPHAAHPRGGHGRSPPRAGARVHRLRGPRAHRRQTRRPEAAEPCARRWPRSPPAGGPSWPPA